jgi:hypothetical protein
MNCQPMLSVFLATATGQFTKSFSLLRDNYPVSRGSTCGNAPPI